MSAARSLSEPKLRRVDGGEELTEERRLAFILEATAAATWQWNVQTSDVRLNERWASILGYTLAELMPTSIDTWLTLTHPGDLAAIQPSLEAHLAGQNADYDVTVRMRHKDGHWVWVHSVGRVMTWTLDGKPEWMFGTHVDLTDRRRQEEALRKSEAFLNRTGVVGGVGGWELDLSEDTLYLSDQVCRIHGVPSGHRPTIEEALGWYAPGARETLHSALERLVDTGEAVDIELMLAPSEGGALSVRVVATRELDAEGKAARIVGAFQDVTVLVAQRRAVESARERLALAADSGSIGIWELDAEKLIHFDAWGCRAYGLPGPTAKVPSREWLLCLHPDDRERALAEASAALEGATTMDTEFRVLWPDGTTHHLRATGRATRDASGRCVGLVGTNWDVTRLRELSAELAKQHETTLVTLNEISHRARHDALTGLVNRGELEARLTRALENAREDGGEHAVMCIDLDQFKLVNDACGHAVGDQLLQQVSKLLQEAVRTSDTVARMGGDEFAILLEHCPLDQAQRIAQKICDRMEIFRFVHDDRRFRIGTSIGLAAASARWPSTEALLQAADTSCFAAKEAGRNRVHTWLDSDQSLVARDVETKWATRLEDALDNDRFVLHAQRIAPTGPGDASCVGLHAEVLLRLVQPDGTLVAPGAFLPAAERFHLAQRIDRWVLRNALAKLSAATDLGTIGTLCVNLSGQSIGDRSFLSHVVQALEAAGPAICRRVCLEITETTAITNLADAAVFVDKVRSLGVRVALDDFGAGASSFGYLKSLTVDLIKIDGQYVKNLLDNALDDTTVRCFVDVARAVGVKTVAEMVETPAVLARLREIGVDYAQGFLVHRPEPLDELLRTRP